MEGSKEFFLSPCTLCHSVSPLPPVQGQALAAVTQILPRAGTMPRVILAGGMGWILLTMGTSSSVLCGTESRAEARGFSALQSH